MGFKENLKKARLQAGFSSARKFSHAIGIPYSRYISYEGNKGVEPSFAELLHIANFLHVSVDSLLGNTLVAENVIHYTEEILKSTPFQILNVSDTTVTIGIQGTNQSFVFKKDTLIHNVQNECAYTSPALNQVVAMRLCVSIKLAICASSSFIDPKIRKALSSIETSDIHMGDMTFPLLSAKPH